MANQIPESMDKAVRVEMMRLLRERVNDPTLQMRTEWGPHPDTREIAAHLLVRTEYVSHTGYITLAGMDYYRRQTANQITTWLKTNWFAVAVAVATVLAAVCGPFFDFLWGIVLP